MKPSELSANLRRVAAKIDNSRRPERILVARELKRILVAMNPEAGYDYGDEAAQIMFDVEDHAALFNDWLGGFYNSQDWTIASVDHASQDEGVVSFTVKGWSGTFKFPFSGDESVAEVHARWDALPLDNADPQYVQKAQIVLNQTGWVLSEDVIRTLSSL